MVLVLSTILQRRNCKVVIDDHIIKVVGNLEGITKTTGSTVIERDCEHDFTGVHACSSGVSCKNNDQFVVVGVIVVNGEVAFSILERGLNKAIANFQGCYVDLTGFFPL